MSKMRWDCITNILKNKEHKIGAEIGVWKGHFTYKILTQLSGIEEYYCIDPWKMYGEYYEALNTDTARKANYNEIYEEFKHRNRRFKDKITILRMMGNQALKKVPDGHLDFVFIDGNHSYKYAKQDIIGWSEKVKSGGLISGHDYGRNKPSDVYVTKAVDELIPNVNKGDNGVWYIFKEDLNG